MVSSSRTCSRTCDAAITSERHRSRDIIVLDSGPPMPVRVFGLALAAATAYEYFGAAGKGKGKKV